MTSPTTTQDAREAAQNAFFGELTPRQAITGGSYERAVDAALDAYDQARAAVPEDVKAIVNDLDIAGVGSCGCLTKAPWWQAHDEDCRWRAIGQAIEALESLAARLAEMTASRDNMHKWAAQHKAERDALRGALRDIANMGAPGASFRARNALNPTPTGQGEGG